MGRGGGWSPQPPSPVHRVSSSKFAGSAGLAANGSWSTSPGVRAAIRAERAGGQATKGPPPARVGTRAAWPGAGTRAAAGPGLGLGGRSRRGACKGARSGGGGREARGLWASCRRSGTGAKTLRRWRERGGRPCTPTAGAGGGWKGGGRSSRTGDSRLRFLSCSPPPPLGAGETAGRAELQAPGSPTPTLCFPRARPGLRCPPPPPRVGAVPLPLLLPKMAAPASEVGGWLHPPPPTLALPFFPPQPFLLRLDAPPRPQPSRARGRADGRRVARPSGADSIILQHQRHLLGRPPASPAG